MDIAVALAGSGKTGSPEFYGEKVMELSNRQNLFKGGGQPLTLANVDADSDGYDDLGDIK